MMRKFATIFSALVLTVALARHGDSSAGVATDQVRTTVNRVLIILKDPALNSADAKEARRAELSKAILPRFDFEFEKSFEIIRYCGSALRAAR